MKDIISKLNKAFENRIRLGIMSILVVNDRVDFNTLKALLDTTDGNLASHLKTLEDKDLIEIKKQFIARKPRTSYIVTAYGRQLFKQHIEALESLINNK
ncbi:MAG: transcriptional regulator [Bacteroidetes bacterium 4484_276]|nr:MAG: transcriptional regulator [Bacteroidetes bacterium 4484_276]